MKFYFLLLTFFSALIASAQLVITPGAELFVTGNTQVTLQNTSFVNDGNFAAGNSNFVFAGNTASFISGSQPVRFFEMEVNKSGNQSVILQRPIAIDSRIHFTSGLLDLNGSNVDLGTVGLLDGEKENSRIIGPNGGEVLVSADLNAPAALNPGNLGMSITSGTNLGNVTIRRGHQSQSNIPGTGNTILRYFDFIAAGNTNADATLKLKYFDGELNNLAENSLVFFNSSNNINWTNLGFTSRDTVTNFVEKTGIEGLGRFTLSSVGTALPVRYVLFNAKCELNKVLLTWKTAQEQNSDYFNIESSSDGIHWKIIGNLPAAGSSDVEKTYSYTDNFPTQNKLYRIAEYDRGGGASYTSIIRSSCDADQTVKAWPNPLQDVLFISILSNEQSQVIIKLFDSRGALVQTQKATLLQGSNQLSLNVRSLANGVYHLSVKRNNGQTEKVIQVIKRD